MYAGLGEQVLTGENYAISYDVAQFEDVVAVNRELEEQGIQSKNAAVEVAAMQESFRSLGRLFFIISILVLFLALFLCAILLFKLQNSRYRELGLLSALGFRAAYLKSMIRWENLLLSGFVAVVTAVLFAVAAIACSILHFPLQVGVVQLFLCMGGAFIVVIGISTLASAKLIRTEPAEALKHE